jgi:hypothetical protein
VCRVRKGGGASGSGSRLTGGRRGVAGRVEDEVAGVVAGRARGSVQVGKGRVAGGGKPSAEVGGGGGGASGRHEEGGDRVVGKKVRRRSWWALMGL